MKRGFFLLLSLAVLGGAIALVTSDDAAPPARDSVVAVDPHGAEIASVRALVVSRL